MKEENKKRPDKQSSSGLFTEVLQIELTNHFLFDNQIIFDAEHA